MCVEKEVKNHLPCAGGGRGYVEGVVHGAVVVLFDMWTKIRIFYKSQVKRDIFLIFFIRCVSFSCLSGLYRCISLFLMPLLGCIRSQGSRN